LPLKISSRGRRELHILLQHSIQESFSPLRQDITRMWICWTLPPLKLFPHSRLNLSFKYSQTRLYRDEGK
jgi:hypothetical protein